MTVDTNQLSTESRPHRMSANNNISARTMNVVCVVSWRFGHTPPQTKVSLVTKRWTVPNPLPPGGTVEISCAADPGHDRTIFRLSVEYRDGAEPEIGVKVAAADAFRRAVADASPLRLEPVMSVEVAVGEDYLGSVIGDLKARRAHVNDISQRGDSRVIEALVGLRNMFGYSTDLRSLTKGRATFTMSFHAYDNLA